jgi:hypothetical protein
MWILVKPCSSISGRTKDVEVVNEGAPPSSLESVLLNILLLRYANGGQDISRADRIHEREAGSGLPISRAAKMVGEAKDSMVGPQKRIGVSEVNASSLVGPREFVFEKGMPASPHVQFGAGG